MAQSDAVVTTISLEQHGFKKVASGKVREIFEVDGNTLLFVATDRISAYDVILGNVSHALGSPSSSLFYVGQSTPGSSH